MVAKPRARWDVEHLVFGGGEHCRNARIVAENAQRCDRFARFQIRPRADCLCCVIEASFPRRRDLFPEAARSGDDEFRALRRRQNVRKRRLREDGIV